MFSSPNLYLNLLARLYLLQLCVESCKGLRSHDYIAVDSVGGRFTDEE